MHVVLFDIDGTLLSSGGAGKAAIEASLVEEFRVTLRKQVPFSGRTDRAIGRDLLQFHDVDPNRANWDKLVSGYLARLPAALATHQGKVLPGITAVLETLSHRDAAIGLLTGNLHRGAMAKLKHFNLWEEFSFGGFGDEHLERDDIAREVFQTIRTRFNGQVKTEQIWVIGDTPLDIGCARAIGAKVVAVATGWHTMEQLAVEKPDLLMTDLSDPAAFFERL